MDKLVLPHVQAEIVINEELRIQSVCTDLKYEIYSKIRNKVEVRIRFNISYYMEDRLFERLLNGRD
jgi:hypothetical protein